MQLSRKAVDWLHQIERLRLKPYDDQTGKDIKSYVKGATVGYGHLISGPAEFSKYANGITVEQADALFQSDIKKFLDAVNRVATKSFVPLCQHQFDAMVILAYNIGAAAFEGSTVAKMFVNPKGTYAYKSLEAAWKAWNKSQGKFSQGVANRRAAEWDMFSKGVYRFW